MHMYETDLKCNQQIYVSGCISVLEIRTPQQYLHSNFSLQKTKIKEKTHLTSTDVRHMEIIENSEMLFRCGH